MLTTIIHFYYGHLFEVIQNNAYHLTVYQKYVLSNMFFYSNKHHYYRAFVKDLIPYANMNSYFLSIYLKGYYCSYSMTITVPFSTPLYFVFTSNNCLVHTECIPFYHILYLASQQSNLEIQSVVICISFYK